MPDNYSISREIFGRAFDERRCLSDVELCDCFDFSAMGFAIVEEPAERQSEAQAGNSPERVEALARFYAEYESSEVSPFDTMDDTDILP